MNNFNAIVCCCVAFVCSCIFVLSAHANSDEYVIEHEVDVFPLQGELLFSHRKEVKVNIRSKAGDFTGLAEVENFFAPIKRSRIEGSKDLNGLVRERRENLERRDVFYNDATVHIWDVRDVRAGDEYIVEYEYEDANIEWFPMFYVPNIDSLAQFIVDVSFPAGYSAIPHVVFHVDSIPYTVTQGSSDVTVEFTDVPNFGKIRGIDENGPAATIFFEVMYEGEVVNPIYADQFVLWYLRSFPYIYPPAEKPTIASMSSVSTLNARERFDSLFSWVKTNIRYIAEADGWNSIVPSKPDTVIERGWGDCKDKAFLLQALFSDDNAKVVPVLVHTSQRNAPTHITNMRMYNHVIVAYIQGNDTVYADPTNPFADPGTLSAGLYGSHALVLDSKQPRLTTLPVMQRQSGMTLHIEVNKQDPAQSTCRLSFDHYYAMRLRALLESTPSGKQHVSLAQMVQRYFREIDIVNISSIVDNGSNIIVEGVADVSGLIVAGSKATYVTSMPFNFLSPVLLSRMEDSLPLRFGDVRNVRLMLTWSGNADLMDIAPYDFTGEHFAFKMQAQNQEANQSTLVFDAQRTIVDLSPKEKSEYLKAVESVLDYRSKLIKIEW